MTTRQEYMKVYGKAYRQTLQYKEYDKFRRKTPRYRELVTYSTPIPDWCVLPDKDVA